MCAMRRVLGSPFVVAVVVALLLLDGGPPPVAAESSVSLFWDMSYNFTGITACEDMRPTHPLLTDPRSQPGTNKYSKLLPDRPTRASSPELHDKYLTSWRCTKQVRNTSCLFHNLYFQDNKRVAALLATDDYPLDKYYLNFNGYTGFSQPPHPLRFSTVEQAAAHFSNVTEVPHFAVGEGGPWHHNFGHGLFDGMYAAFTGLVDFGLQDESYDLYFKNDPCTPKICDTEIIMQQMSGGRMYLSDSVSKLYQGSLGPGSPFLKFAHFVFGAGRKGQRVLTAGGDVGAGRESNAMYHFTRRIYKRFGHALPVRKNFEADPVFRVCIILNKRFTSQDMQAFERLEYKYKAANSRIKITVVDLGNVQPFDAQLALYANMDCYVTGVGTGMMPHPFAREGAVVINVGECRELELPHCYVVTFREQYMTEASPYQRALYYNSSRVCEGVNERELDKLIQKAYTMRSLPSPTPQFENLSPEGRIFAEYCLSLPSDECEKNLDDFNKFNIFIEFLIYDAGQYYLPQNASDPYKAYIDELGPRLVNRTRIAEMKKAYADVLMPHTIMLPPKKQ